MPSLPFVSSSYIKRVRDSLMHGPGSGFASASLALGSGTSAFRIIAREAGAAGNNITIQVVVPGGTSPLSCSAAGNAVTISLSVNSGTPVAADNTALRICNALNTTAATSALVEAALVGNGSGSLSVASGPTALSGGVTGSANNSSMQSLPMNFLRAQDMASVLEVLQSSLSQPTALTATGGTLTSVQDTGAFVANSQVGNKVRFNGNVTTALAGVVATVVSNTANACFFANGALPAAPQSGDTYTIIGACMDPVISKLRDGRGSGDSPAGNVFGDSRLVVDALVRLTRQLGGTVSDRTVMSGSTASGSTTTRVVLNTRGVSLRYDQFKGLRLTVTGFGTRKIVGNDENSVFFDLPFSSAPGSGVAFTIALPQDSSDASANLTFAPGGQPADNRLLAELIRVCQSAVIAFVLPT